MTRLLTDDIREIAATMPAYDRQLQARTGLTLGQLALRANGRVGQDAPRPFDEAATVVVPLTSGQGIIGRFAAAVASILQHIGFDARVSERPDVGGLSDAYEEGACMVVMADDHTFSAINLVTRQVADNSTATGRGFATALELMAGPLADNRVLVLGCGPVGQSAARALAASDARVGLYDTNMDKARSVAALLNSAPFIRVHVEDNYDDALSAYDLILDATPVGDIITRHHVTARTMIAAPGVPCGLHADAQAKMASRLVHDPLQIGVAVMAVEAWLPPQETAS